MQRLTLIFCVLSLFACQTTEKKERQQDLKVGAFWVQDTLKEPNIGYRKVNRFAPVLFKDLIIVANGLEGLVAYDIFDKTKKWSLAIDQGVEAAGAVVNSRLFVGGLNGIFYSIDLDTAKIVWQFDTKSEVVAEPLVQDGLVFFLSGSNILYCLDANNGRQMWVYNRQDTAAQMTVRGGAKPSYSSGQIYQGFSDGSLVSLNAKTGTPQWEVLLNRNTKFKDIDASAVIDGDTIYINSYDDKLYAVSKSSGTILWKSEFGGASAPLVLQDRLTYTSSKGHLMVVSKKNGELLWKISNLKGIATEPVNHKGLIVIGESQGAVLFYDLLTGVLKSSFDPGRGVLGRITTDKKNRVYFISGEANVYGLTVEYANKHSNFSFLE
jgi:outer membrane protein assembly factor BamB